MMKPTLAAAALAALVALPNSADAAGPFCKRQNGIDWCSRQVWNNQLAIGEPVMAFPLGCRGDACDFTVRLEFFEGITEDELETCDDDIETPQYECSQHPNCVLSVWFGPNVMTVRDWHGRHQGTGDPKTNAVINDVALYLPRGRSFLAPSWEGHTSFTGNRYQWLGVIMGDVEVFDNGLCRVNISAGYHPNNKAFGSRGLLLPPIQ